MLYKNFLTMDNVEITVPKGKTLEYMAMKRLLLTLMLLGTSLLIFAQDYPFSVVKSGTGKRDSFLSISSSASTSRLLYALKISHLSG